MKSHIPRQTLNFLSTNNSLMDIKWTFLITPVHRWKIWTLFAYDFFSSIGILFQFLIVDNANSPPENFKSVRSSRGKQKICWFLGIYIMHCGGCDFSKNIPHNWKLRIWINCLSTSFSFSAPFRFFPLCPLYIFLPRPCIDSRVVRAGAFLSFFRHGHGNLIAPLYSTASPHPFTSLLLYSPIALRG